MKTYWDNTDIEKIKMTQEEVQTYIDIELMTNGVVKVNKPNFQEIKDVSNFEKVPYYFCAGILFETLDQVEAFLKLNPMKEEYDYYGGGYEYKYAVPVDKGFRLESLFKRSDILDNAIIFKSNKTAKEFNEAEKKRYEKELATMDGILSPILDDWNKMQSLKYKCECINRTYLEYLKMTNNDEVMAKNFLTKIYPSSEIELAQKLINLEKGQL